MYFRTIAGVVILAVAQFVMAGDVARFLVPEHEVRVVLYVDVGHPAAADTNPGTNPAAPFKTVGAAAAAAMSNKAQNVGAKIVIAPGVYREGVVLRMRGYNARTEPGALDTAALRSWRCARCRWALASGEHCRPRWSSRSAARRAWCTSCTAAAGW